MKHGANYYGTSLISLVLVYRCRCSWWNW